MRLKAFFLVPLFPMIRRSKLKMNEEMQSQFDPKTALEYARMCGRLKKTKRTGWVYRKVLNPESVAEHSWRVASLAFLLIGTNINVSRCVELAVAHDLSEALVGDIAPMDNVSKEEKRRLEDEAMLQISNSVRGADGFSDAMTRMFNEYEERYTEEGQAVKDLDLLEMIIQADEYERENVSTDGKTLNLQEFFDSTGVERFKNERIKGIAIELHRQRVERLKNETVITSSSDSSTFEKLDLRDRQFVKDYVDKSVDVDVEDISNVVYALRLKDREQ
mmetsp:Transcript_4893/g.6623  ORF Transcript_4893/g.6623 Transcript_4893/m.6623 type:complete len:276 (+) Transcript_4893:68-895(+)